MSRSQKSQAVFMRSGSSSPVVCFTGPTAVPRVNRALAFEQTLYRNSTGRFPIATCLRVMILLVAVVSYLALTLRKRFSVLVDMVGVSRLWIAYLWEICFPVKKMNILISSH
jgi:hypothetical protein